MDFIVRYRTAAGDEKYEEMVTLERAAQLVERLRNDAGVSDARIYRHVPIEFKTYYKVSVAGEDVGAASTTPPSAAEDAPDPAPAPALPPATPSAAPSGSSSSDGSPPPGSMPLTPPAAKAADDEATPPPGEGERRTLFTRG